VLDAADEVMREALAQGGTSFDSLYVNVNGESGYFDRSLAVYGQARGLHEPVVVPLPALPTAPAGPGLTDPTYPTRPT